MMKKVLKFILLVLALVVIAVQFVRPPKNIAREVQRADLMVLYPPSSEVKQLLTTACYDCHSNTTRYPWYAEIQPGGWWLRSHIQDGKNELNFSEFGDYSTRRKIQKLGTASDEVRDNSMPLNSYLWIHRDARLSPAQRKVLADWFDAVVEKIEDEN